MNELFDTAPFAYVGENTHYKDLSKEEKDELKKMKPQCEVKKEALPSSEEVKESSASTVGSMIPQIGLSGTEEEPDVDDLFADVDEESLLLKEALDDVVNGADIYFEKSAIIEKIKGIFTKGDKPVDKNKVMRVAKAYTSLKMANSRLRITLAKDYKNKNTPMYRELKKKAIAAEKEYRKLKKGLNENELKALVEYTTEFDDTFDDKLAMQIVDIKAAKKAAIKTESVEIDDAEDIVQEVAAETAVVAITSAICVGLIGYACYIEKKQNDNIKKCAKILEKLYPEFINPKDMDKKRYKIIKGIDKDYSRGKEIKNKFVQALTGKYIDVYEYKGKEIFSYVRDYDTSISHGISSGSISGGSIGSISMNTTTTTHDYKFYFNLIDDSMKQFEKFYLAFAANKSGLRQEDAWNWSEKFIEDHKEEVKKESAEIVTERDLDPEMKPIIEKLHSKGYKTSASSSGHNNLVAKDDRTKNGVRDGLLYSDARLVFKGKNNFGKAPKYWYWKKVDNADEVDYLDIEQTRYETQPGGPSNAFQDWKRKYMRSLEEWVDSLPDVNDKKEEEPTKESVEDINKQIDILYESVLGNMFADIEIDNI